MKKSAFLFLEMMSLFLGLGFFVIWHLLFQFLEDRHGRRKYVPSEKQDFMSGNRCVMIPEVGEVPRFEPFRIGAEKWRDGIVVRSPNWLGDAVMSLPALLQLKSLLPEFCGLFVVCPRGIAPLFRAMACVDRVIPVSNPHAFLSSEERQAVKRLLPGVGVLFNNSFRDALSLKLARVPMLFGAQARNRGWLLKRSYAFPKRRTAELNRPHQAAKYMAIAEALGAAPWDGVLPEMRDLTGREEMAPELADLLGKERLLAVAGGAAYGAAKRWPAPSFRSVAERWIREKDGFVVALGSKGERPIAEEILAGLPSDRVWNGSGRTSLEELMLILKHSAMCVANDSGVMHLAALLGVPGVAPFGSTDPIATSPLSGRWRIVFDKQECSPCFRRVCPKGTRECFRSLTPEFVWEVLKDLPPRH